MRESVPLTESLKNVIHIMGNAYQSVWPRIYSLLSPIVTYCHIVDQTSDLLLDYTQTKLCIRGGFYVGANDLSLTRVK